MLNRRRPSLLGALLWIGLGLLFLLYNFGIVHDFWSLAGRYWPVLLILLGLGKILEYFLKKDAVSIRVGEIIGILLLLLIGTALTQSSSLHMGRIIRDMQIDIGGTRMSPGQLMGDSHTYSEEVAFPLESSIPIRVENAYGTVSVTAGNDREIRVNLKKVVYENEARAKAIASEIHLQGGPENLDGSSVTLKPEAEPGSKPGSRYFVLRTNRDALSSRNYQFKTDMEILVPKNSQVQVANSYGEVRASQINGTLDLSTINKPLEVRDCTGQFNISTRYAECRLTNLKGNLNVDARGKVYIESIKGDVTVKNEYAPLEISGVDGKLDVSSTESNLKVEKVTKSVVINARGTKVQVAALKDSLKIIASHRDVDISDVASQVVIESRYASLNLRDIQGDIEINSNSDNISADDIRGRFMLKARGSGVRVNGIRGPLDIQTTLKDVVVNNFGDSCKISNEYARISLSSLTLGKDVNVKNRNGDVDLFLPEGAAFTIDATARNGKVESDYAGLVPTLEANTGSLKSKVRAGGPKITLETDYSNIHVYRSQDGENQGSAETGKALFPSRTPDLARRPLNVLPHPM
jgi:hypothetical protein